MYKEFIDTSHDEKLKKIEHFKLHPELLPFVGANYNKYKVLLVGESHYVNFRNLFVNWYEEKTEKTWKNESNGFTLNEFKSWFNTREIVNNFLCGKRTPAHKIFLYPAQIIQEKLGENCLSESAAFSFVVFLTTFNVLAQFQEVHLTR